MNLSVEVTFKDGHKETFDNPELAANATGLSEASIKSRCSREGTGKKDGIFCRWADEHTRKSKQAKRNKNKGSSAELEVVKQLKNIGYEGCVSSRSQSKRMDDMKIDIIDLEERLPINIQVKYTQNTPSYFGIRDECPLKDKPFTVIWKKATNDGTNSPGTVAIVDVDFFYQLLKVYNENIYSN